jgi:hypothetical protein
MPQTQRFIVASFALIAGIGLGLFISQVTTLETPVIDVTPVVMLQATSTNEALFKQSLIPRLEARFGTTSSGFEPQRLMYAFPGFILGDFHRVEAVIGVYEYKDGYLWYKSEGTADAAADDISDAGYVTLFKNLMTRLALPQDTPLEEVTKKLEEGVAKSATGTSAVPPQAGACPADAKQCPDGSYVARAGSACEFAACPVSGGGSSVSVNCTPEQRQAEACIEIYAPVCGAMQVECVTTPCNPVPQTFPNSCFACAEDRVISYTEGVCAP